MSSARPLSATENALIARLNRERRRVIRIPEDIPLIAQTTGSEGAARALVESLAAKDWLVPIRRGIWALRSRALTIDVSAFEIVGMVSPQLHLVTGGSALARHQLSDQSFRSIVVVTASKPRDWEWQGETVRYVTMPAARIWGATERQAFLPTRLAGEERALLDSLAHPRWGVSLSHLVEALDRYLTRVGQPEKLALATARYRNSHVARRLGFLVEQLRGEQAASPFLALRGSTKGAVPLNLTIPVSRQPQLNSRWGIRSQDVETLVGAK